MKKRRYRDYYILSSILFLFMTFAAILQIIVIIKYNFTDSEKMVIKGSCFEERIFDDSKKIKSNTPLTLKYVLFSKEYQNFLLLMFIIYQVKSIFKIMEKDNKRAEFILNRINFTGKIIVIYSILSILQVSEKIGSNEYSVGYHIGFRWENMLYFLIGIFLVETMDYLQDKVRTERINDINLIKNKIND
ncbi:hypothetical protein [Haliovirga abyssi]|uniref:DUF2975 domain-containing protein n=1 Tax=Haliovirga abyssi TaxID=2996794 RepID=A0AAU9DED1_9FUSO|nr:hypothetical protein [Haliovirga abyssi]BDU50558.1 hypothetical protein HLVA_11270 [Haliovirga abyssi]